MSCGEVTCLVGAQECVLYTPTITSQHCRGFGECKTADDCTVEHRPRGTACILGASSTSICVDGECTNPPGAALLVKRPALFESVRDLPPDLDAVVRALRRNEVPPSFRGIPGEALLRWLSRVGRQLAAQELLRKRCRRARLSGEAHRRSPPHGQAP